MSKKHFQAVADEFREARKVETDPALREAIDRLAARMANIFGNLNPRFDRPRFLRACGKED